MVKLEPALSTMMTRCCHDKEHLRRSLHPGGECVLVFEQALPATAEDLPDGIAFDFSC